MLLLCPETLSFFSCANSRSIHELPEVTKRSGSIAAFMCPKVDIDREECSGCGLCYNDDCPEVFVEGDSGLSDIKMELREGEPGQGRIPENLRACVEKAADACPVSAIVVLED